MIAPARTASFVNRYAVPSRTPTFTPFSASAALRAATMLARECIVNAAGKDDVQIVRRLAADVLQQHLDHRFPQREARARTDVPAALLSLEDEAPRAVLQKHLQQTRRRHVQVRRDALRFQFPGLIGAAAGDDRERRLVRPNRFQLFAANLVRDEAEDADAPGLLPELRLRFRE